MKLQLAVYVEGLSQLPADIAFEVLRKPRQWFPTLYELQEEAKQIGRDRLMLRDALKAV